MREGVPGEINEWISREVPNGIPENINERPNAEKRFPEESMKKYRERVFFEDFFRDSLRYTFSYIFGISSDIPVMSPRDFSWNYFKDSFRDSSRDFSQDSHINSSWVSSRDCFSRDCFRDLSLDSFGDSSRLFRGTPFEILSGMAHVLWRIKINQLNNKRDTLKKFRAIFRAFYWDSFRILFVYSSGIPTEICQVFLYIFLVIRWKFLMRFFHWFLLVLSEIFPDILSRIPPGIHWLLLGFI